MICRVLRFLPGSIGMAIDIAVQMRRHNRMVAQAHAERDADQTPRSK